LWSPRMIGQTTCFPWRKGVFGQIPYLNTAVPLGTFELTRKRIFGKNILLFFSSSPLA